MDPIRPLPCNHGLFIVTPKTVYLHSRDDNKVLFKCETADGIINARAAKDNSSLLAIADSHVVILYDAAKGKDRKYTLKNSYV